jgi:hypothetical protein
MTIYLSRFIDHTFRIVVFVGAVDLIGSLWIHRNDMVFGSIFLDNGFWVVEAHLFLNYHWGGEIPHLNIFQKRSRPYIV